MNRFYVTLLSNSSADYYHENTVARYTTKLADKIELESEWEVGLAEISFPSEVENVVYGQCYVDLYINDVLIRRMTNGYAVSSIPYTQSNVVRSSYRVTNRCSWNFPMPTAKYR